jgi:hypothetical protein
MSIVNKVSKRYVGYLVQEMQLVEYQQNQNSIATKLIKSNITSMRKLFN